MNRRINKTIESYSFKDVGYLKNMNRLNLDGGGLPGQKYAYFLERR